MNYLLSKASLALFINVMIPADLTLRNTDVFSVQESLWKCCLLRQLFRPYRLQAQNSINIFLVKFRVKLNLKRSQKNYPANNDSSAKIFLL